MSEEITAENLPKLMLNTKSQTHKLRVHQARYIPKYRHKAISY